MNWYTQDDGVLCLGTKGSKYAYFHVATDVKMKQSVNTSLSESDIEIIGSFPEDWRTDKTIADKINNAAKHLFGSSKPSAQAYIV
jgi:hypothetical protein